MYLIFRAMWARYWCKLNTISTMPGTLLPLCKLFEDLTQQYIPRAVFHLSCLGVSALRIAFPWIRYAFVGYLEVDQVSERCECARTSLADVHRGCVRGFAGVFVVGPCVWVWWVGAAASAGRLHLRVPVRSAAGRQDGGRR